MSEKIENIDQLFKDELNGYSPEVPAGAWDNIAAGIPAKPIKKILPIFWRAAAAIVLLLVSGIIGYSLLENNNLRLNEVSETVSTEKNTEAEITSVEKFNNTLVNQESDINTQESNVKTAIASHSGKAEKQFSNNTGESTLTPNSKIKTQNRSPNNKTVIPNTKDNLNNQEPNLISVNRILAIVPSIVSPEEIKDQSKAKEEEEWFAAFHEQKKSVFDKFPSERQSKWMVGGQAGPQYSYREISSPYMTQELLDARHNDNEEGVVAYAGGINIEFSPAKRLSIQSGVHYSKMGLQSPLEETSTYYSQSITAHFNPNYTKDNSVTYKASSSTGNVVFNNSNAAGVESNQDTYMISNLEVPAADGEQNGISETSSEISNLSQYFEYIEIPLIARYAIIDRKVDVHVLGGVSTNFLVGNSAYIDDGKESVGYTEGMNSINYSATAGFGVGYNLNERMNISIEPQLKYYLNEQTSGTGVEVHPYSLGIMTGVKYLF